MKFDPEKQKLVCQYCDKELDPKDYRAPKAAEASEQQGYYTATIYTCPQCGAEILSTEETVATFCSYCGTSVILEGRASEQERPNMVIPFRIGKKDAEASYRRLVKQALFAPNDLKADSVIEKFRGIYMPYWVYSLETDEEFKVRGVTEVRNGDYIEKSTYEIKSPVKASFEGISFDASSGFADNLSDAIAPFRPKDHAVDFDPAYLSGYYADAGDLSPDVYRDDAKEVAVDNIAAQIQNQFNYSKYSVNRSDLKKAIHYNDSSKSALFPVWFMSVRNKKGDRISYAVVNGETGKAAAEIPIDFKKYLLGALLIAVPVFVLLNLFLTAAPFKMLLASTVLALLSYVIADRQLNKVYAREMFLDDKGKKAAGKVPVDKKWQEAAAQARVPEKSNKTLIMVLKRMTQVGLWIVMLAVFLMLAGVVASVLDIDVSDSLAVSTIGAYILTTVIVTRKVGNWFNKKAGIQKKEPAVKAKSSYKSKYLFKQLAAVGIAALMLVMRPTDDYYYYIAAGVAFLLIVWSFYDIIRQQNLLTTRKLPHLNARGGDENA
ncbi:MAG: zinc ribbon domain-containing protein [Clostridia bacterium]|nr:zinc ribbon domain-containing protein [Clostridia bacterium]